MSNHASARPVRAFDSGPLTTGLPLGRSAHLIMRANGDFSFACHAHDSGSTI
jgi:hypothetical protein